MSFTKYVKNNTASIVTYVGIPINPGAYYLIQAPEDDNFSSNPTLITDIGNTDAIMAYDNSGSNDISDINEAIDFLKNNITKVTLEGVDIVNNAVSVDAAVSVQSEISSFDNTALIELSQPNQNLPRANQAHYTVYTYTGSGLLANFVMDLNSENIELVIDIDGNEIFNGNIKLLKSMYDNAKSYRTWLVYDKTRKSVVFSPEFPIKYETSVLIKSRANSNNNGRRLERFMIDITKD